MQTCPQMEAVLRAISTKHGIDAEAKDAVLVLFLDTLPAFELNLRADGTIRAGYLREDHGNQYADPILHFCRTPEGWVLYKVEQHWKATDCARLTPEGVVVTDAECQKRITERAEKLAAEWEENYVVRGDEARVYLKRSGIWPHLARHLFFRDQRDVKPGGWWHDSGWWEDAGSLLCDQVFEGEDAPTRNMGLTAMAMLWAVGVQGLATDDYATMEAARDIYNTLLAGDWKNVTNSSELNTLIERMDAVRERIKCQPADQVLLVVRGAISQLSESMGRQELDGRMRSRWGSDQ